MTGPQQPSPDKSQPDGTDNPQIPVEADIFAKLQNLADARGVSINEVIRQLIEGEGHCPPHKEVNLAALTPKQALVLEHLKSGLSVKETANEMGVSEETVRTHILRARSRLRLLRSSFPSLSIEPTILILADFIDFRVCRSAQAPSPP